jgi:hypothetical protein
MTDIFKELENERDLFLILGLIYLITMYSMRSYYKGIAINGLLALFFVVILLVCLYNLIKIIFYKEKSEDIIIKSIR